VCESGKLAMFNYTIPPPAEHKGQFLVNITISYQWPTIFFMQRFNAYDPKTGRYFLIGVTDYDAPIITQLFIVNTHATPLTVQTIQMPEADHLTINSLQWDTTTDTLYGVFDTSVMIIDITSGGLKLHGSVGLGEDIQYVVDFYDTAYDSASGQYWIPIMDLTHGYRRLVTYNTHDYSKSFITGNLNYKGDYWILYGFKYLATNDTLFSYVTDPYRWPSVKGINYRTAEWWDVIPDYVWNSYEPGYSLWPDSDETNNLNWLDADLNIFWMTVRYTDPEDEIYEAVVYYNLTKYPTVLLGSGPMVLYQNACWFTNQVWFHW